MRVTTLGMLTVDGQPVRGHRLATLVRALVDAQGRPVTVAALIDALWGLDIPRDAPGALQALVSRVRRLGLPVVAVADGYRLPTDGLWVDAYEASAAVQRAREHLRSGRYHEARRSAEEARALLPAAPDLTDARVRSLFRGATTVRAEAVLAASRTPDERTVEAFWDDAGPTGPDIDANLESDLRLLATGPAPDEPAAVLLVRLLAAAGRETEALELVDAVRREVKQRYGTDPSPVLAQAHVALLRGELSALTSTSPARAAPSRPHGSPLPTSWRRATTPLVGRDRDLAALTDQLADGALVTIVGPGGVGKTRLAAEVARRTAARGGPVRVVELAGVRSADAVAGTIAAALSGSEPTRTRSSTLDGSRRTDGTDPIRRAARDLVGLVVLDNCEHVLDAVAQAVGQILAMAPRAVVLATSRAPLGLVGETVYRLGALTDDDALALLEARARAGGATLSWSRERALALCHRLDNLPLALELAAARLRHMPIDEVLAGLEDRFGLLDDALRGLPERHASLWAMVDWSHQLLPPEVRQLWWRLSVIPAPFTVDMAIAVADTVPRVRAGLAMLVDQSLLTLDHGDDGTPRYRMLETVREYGEVRLAAAEGARAAAMAGLVAWAAARAAELAPDLLGAGQVTALTQLAADADTLTAALRWSITTGDEVSAVDIARSLFHLWMVQGRHGDVLDWSVPLLRVDDPLARRASMIVNGSAAASGQPLPNAENLAWTLLLIGGNATVAGVGTTRLVAVGRRALRRLCAERREQLSPRVAALAWLPSSVDIADLEKSRPIAERLVAHDDPLVQGFGLFLSAVGWASVGDDERALADNLAAYERFAAVGDQWMMGMAAQGVATRLATAGRPGGLEWLRRGAAHLAVVGATADAQSLQVQLDAQLALAGDEPAAKRLAHTATDAGTEPMNIVIARIGLAELAIRRGRYAEALEHIEAVARSGPAWPPGQGTVVAQSAAAVLRLWAVDIAPSPDDVVAADRYAVAQLQASRFDAFATGDLPTLAAWALAGAELAAHRGCDDVARELWAVAVRLGARVVYPFQEGHHPRLSRALGDHEQREALLGPWRSSSVPAVIARVRELMAEVLDGQTLRR